jgi:hypothetical protein
VKAAIKSPKKVATGLKTLYSLLKLAPEVVAKLMVADARRVKNVLRPLAPKGSGPARTGFVGVGKVNIGDLRKKRAAQSRIRV